MQYSAREYEVLFDQTADTGISIRPGVKACRTKTIKAGPVLECEIFPIWATQAQASQAKKAKGRTREAQKRLNERNAQKRITRKINANFGKGDLMITNTYRDGQQPETEEQAQRDMQNFTRRLKALRKRKGLGATKYVYITERTESKKYGIRYHHHAIISGDGLDRDEVEALWPYGNSNTKRYQTNDRHLTGFAHYITKKKATQEKITKRRWSASKNLDDPKTTVADHKISVRKMQRIAAQIEDEARAIFERAYPGYILAEAPTIRWSEYCAGVYIYATMIKASEAA